MVSNKNSGKNLRADDSISVRVESCPLFSRNNFFGRRSAGLGGARVDNLIPFPLVRWGNSGRRRVCRSGSLGSNILFRGYRRFSRTRGFTLRARNTLDVVGDNGSFFDFSTYRKGRKRNKIWMVL
jgi:hypothetical protein